MKITKLGHCCLYIEINGIYLLTDPGTFSDTQNSISPVDIVLITHEHADHLHVASVAAVLSNNPQAVVYTNQAVAALLNAAGIAAILLEGSDQLTVKGITLKAFNSQHEEIYEALGQVQNTGYLIADRLFYPGDSFHEPHCPVEVLALPVAGPWCTVGAAIRYALRVEPKAAFPVHDGMIVDSRIGSFHTAPKAVLESAGITFIALKAGESAVF